MTSRSSGAQRPWWRPRWYELLPEILLVGGLVVFLVDEPDAATSAFKSGRAVALMAGAAIVWIVARVVLARWTAWRGARTVLFAVAALGALAIVVLPAYRNETVVERLPGAPPPTTETASAPAPPTTRAAAVDVVSPVTTIAPSEGSTTSTTMVPTTIAVTTAPAPAEPRLLRTGPFAGIDHRASGTVAIYRTAEGRHVVGLESFDIQPGPDYDVYLVPGPNRADREGGTRLDDLRGNRGTQYYEVPSDVGVGAGQWTVLIWCQTFGVPVANATPA